MQVTKTQFKAKLNNIISGIISVLFNKPKKLAYARVGVRRSGAGRRSRR